MKNARFFLSVVSVAIFAGCTTIHVPIKSGKNIPSAKYLKEARSTKLQEEERVALYLQAAENAASMFGSQYDAAAREVYNAAAAELTVILEDADNGRLWNRPLTVSSGSKTYRLRFQAGSKDGAWSPTYFDSYIPVHRMDEKRVTKPIRIDGVGGALVGIRKPVKKEMFIPKQGMAAPVTATLEFRGQDVTLVLNDPKRRSNMNIAGVRRVLSADFSAPLTHYKTPNQLKIELLGGFRPGKILDYTGLYTIEPYDPSRIPVIYVHGLLSSPYIWIDPINNINQDPVLRKRYQAMVFAYPTGNPAAYSALRFREALAEFEKRNPLPNGFVIISHSLGGIISHMQAATLDREDWRKVLGSKADKMFDSLPSDNIITKSLLFEANPHVKRVIFIATPHRGATMAEGSLAGFARRLIRLPSSLVNTMNSSVLATIKVVSGDSEQLPTIVNSLSPKNVTLKVLDTERIIPPCHSIVGTKGKIGPLKDSSDGLVPYWSSHLDYSKSEITVPGPHCCYNYPEAIAETKRILHLHLQK